MERPLSDELARIPLLQTLAPEELQQLCEHARVRVVEERERVFDHGQPASHFYYLRRGLLKLFRVSPEGAEKVIAIIQPGETFAEAVIFSGQEAGYPVNCEALAQSEVIALDGATMVALLRKSPDTSLRMLGQLSRRLREQVHEIESLTLHNATTRLVSYLLRLAAGEHGESVVRLSMPKHVLASRLNIQPETLSRIFARLSRDGLIEVHGLDVVLRDRDGLARLNDL